MNALKRRYGHAKSITPIQREALTAIAATNRPVVSERVYGSGGPARGHTDHGAYVDGVHIRSRTLVSLGKRGLLSVVRRETTSHSLGRGNDGSNSTTVWAITPEGRTVASKGSP